MTNKKMSRDAGLTVAVLGAAGCLGSHIVERLARGEDGLQPTCILALDRYTTTPAVIEEMKMLYPQITYLCADMTDKDIITKVLEGVDGVIANASIVEWGNGTLEHLMHVNHGGMQNVMRACVHQRVKAIVYTSTMDVIIPSSGIVLDASTSDMEPISRPVEMLYDPAYVLSKAAAETLVNQYDRHGGKLQTLCLRPTGIYGERDPYHIGSALAAASQSGRMNLFRVGDGSVRFQHTYVGNVASAHVFGLASMLHGKFASSETGRAYLITDSTEAENFFDFVAPFLVARGMVLPSIRIPSAIALCSAICAEVVRDCLRFLGKDWKPVLTRYAVRGVTTSQVLKDDTFNRLSGWSPPFSAEEAHARTMSWVENDPSLPSGPFAHVTGYGVSMQPKIQSQIRTSARARVRSANIASRQRQAYFATAMQGFALMCLIISALFALKGPP